MSDMLQCLHASAFSSTGRAGTTCNHRSYHKVKWFLPEQ
jgi:hypothetical protein